jgi:hypothetical protein
MLQPCSRAQELRELIRLGQWPAACPAELREHVSECRSCSDLVLVDEAFRQARAASAASARLMPPGVLWWRAQLRRRNEALERIARPLISAEVFALALALLAGVGYLVFEALTGDAWLAWLEDLPESVALHWDNLVASATGDPAWTWMMLAPALLLLGGVAVAYMATDRR